MSWLTTLRERVALTGAPVCFGIDPNPERIPGGDTGAADYYLRILDAMQAADCLPAVVKPNIAYFEAMGLSASGPALAQVLRACQALKLPVLLDAKRGDIGRSSAAYVRAVFDQAGADAVTVSPYMGNDSIAPFAHSGRGVYLLCRTSNPGAADLQDLMVGDRPLYMQVAERICGEWWFEGVGAVVGATAPAELHHVAHLFARSAEAGREVSLLLPGIGAQGGDPQQVAKVLRGAGYDPTLALFSASSSIAFAGSGEAAAQAAVDALRELRDAVASAVEKGTDA